jgi:thiol-disulfide isomerase/thioredoxin
MTRMLMRGKHPLLFYLLVFNNRSFAQDILSDTSKTFVHVGQKVPPFSVRTLDGAAVSSSTLRGKVLLINFWATWCGPCRAEMPALEKDVWGQFKSGQFEMVAIAREETEQRSPLRRGHRSTRWGATH